MQRLGYTMPIPALGMAPSPPPGTSEGILSGLTAFISGTLAAVFLVRVMRHEKNYIWRTVGFTALGASAVGAIQGLARILTEFVPEKRS